MPIHHITIGSAADILGVSVHTLRQWDKSGKLTAKRDVQSGYRTYKTKDLEVFRSKNGTKKRNGHVKLIP